MPELYIYRLSQRYRTGYSTFDSCVVVSESEDKAKLIHPYGGQLANDGNYSIYDWCRLDEIEQIEVELIGNAVGDWSEGIVICASFNAG